MSASDPEVKEIQEWTSMSAFDPEVKETLKKIKRIIKKVILYIYTWRG